MKIIGAILILISSVVISYYYEKSLKNKIKIGENLVEFISFIKTEIEYFSNPINKIHEKYTKKSDEIIALSEGKKIKIFGNELDRYLFDFFSSIGKGFKKEQLSLCDYTLNIINDNLTKLKSEFANKIKVFRAMVMFFSICAIILLI